MEKKIICSPVYQAEQELLKRIAKNPELFEYTINPVIENAIEYNTYNLDTKTFKNSMWLDIVFKFSFWFVGVLRFLNQDWNIKL